MTKSRVKVNSVLLVQMMLVSLAAHADGRQMESLGRGVVAIHQGDGKVYVGWRLLGSDPNDIAFNLYRTSGGQAVKLNDQPISQSTNYGDSGVDLSKPNGYFVKPVVSGEEQEASASFTLPADAPAQPFLAILLQTPDGYTPNDASVGDLDGDGRDEIIYGACAIDHDGKGLYTTGLGHGDAMHLSDIDPDRPGLEVWSIHERPSHPYGASLLDAAPALCRQTVIFTRGPTVGLQWLYCRRTRDRFPGWEKKNRAGMGGDSACPVGIWTWEDEPGLVPDRTLGFSHAPAFPLRGLLVVGGSLHIADQPLLLAQLLETPDHLLHGLARTHLDF